MTSQHNRERRPATTRPDPSAGSGPAQLFDQTPVLASTAGEHAVHGTLRALTHAEPAPGIEARLLARLEGELEGKKAFALGVRTDPTRKQRRSLGWLVLAPAAAALLLLIFAVLFTWQHPSLKPGTAAGSAPPMPPASRSPADALRYSNAPLPPDLAQSKSPLRQGRPRISVHESSFAPGTPASPAAVSTAKVGSPLPIHLEATLGPAAEDPALADFHATSHPAPRLPPTDQERFVLLMLRRGERHDLAQLDRAQQAAFEQQEQLARHDFFDPPPPPQPDLPGVIQ